jgi:uncharacterized protein
MRWEGRRQSQNVEDRRSAGQQALVGGGLLTLLFMIVMMFLGVDPMQLMQVAPQLGGPAPAAKPGKPVNDEVSKFIKTVLADNEDVWSAIFPKAFGRRFAPTRLVMFTGRVQSACGIADAGAGPFYCPLDKTVYIDPVFYEELKRRFGAPGDFAQAYVIAHEIGHHIQNQLGLAERVQTMKERYMQQGDPTQANQMSVRMELQADYLAGVWARNMAQYAGVLDEQDIREAVNAAAAIGDDRIQKRAQGYVVPEAFTHGSSEQRVRWFLYGLKTDTPEQVVERMNEAFVRDNP